MDRETLNAWARELAESWINGNLTHVHAELAKLGAYRCAALTAAVMCELIEYNDGGHEPPERQFADFLAQKAIE